MVRIIFLAISLLLSACASAGTQPAASPAPSTATMMAMDTASPATTLTNAASPTTLPSVTASPSPTAAAAAPTPLLAGRMTLTPPGPLSGTALLEALRGGGYILYFRHAATNPTPDDAVPVVLEDCTTQRNLSSAGQAQAREIGQAFERLAIPVGQVLASPFCRALDTARLAFGPVEIDPLLENLETAAGEAEREKRIAALRRLLATPPEPGTNTVLSGHGFNINAAAQVTFAEGGAAIFHPSGPDGFTLVATVPPGEWAALEP